MDAPALLEDDRAGARIDRLDVEVGEPRRLRELLALGVERPDIRDPIAIGQEVHGVARPHGIHVLRVGPRRRDQIVGLEVDDPDRTVLTAAIVATLLVPGAVHAVSDVRSARRNLALIAARQGQRLLDAARGRHGPESRRGVGRPARSPGREHDGRTVGRPALDGVGTGVPREAFGIAALGGNDVHIRVPGILSAEGNRSPVGRKVRVGRLALKARESSREAAGAFDDPDVVGVGKGDLRRAHRRRSQQPRRVSVGRGVEHDDQAGNHEPEDQPHAQANRTHLRHQEPPGRDPKGKRRPAGEKARLRFCASITIPASAGAGHP